MPILLYTERNKKARRRVWTQIREVQESNSEKVEEEKDLREIKRQPVPEKEESFQTEETGSRELKTRDESNLKGESVS